MRELAQRRFLRLCHRDRRNPAALADGRINRIEMFKNGVIGSWHPAVVWLPRHLNGYDFCPIKKQRQQRSHLVRNYSATMCSTFPRSNDWKFTIQIAFKNLGKAIPTVVCSLWWLWFTWWGLNSNSSWGGCAFMAVLRIRHLLLVSTDDSMALRNVLCRVDCDWLSLNFNQFKNRLGAYRGGFQNFEHSAALLFHLMYLSLK